MLSVYLISLNCKPTNKLLTPLLTWMFRLFITNFRIYVKCNFSHSYSKHVDALCRFVLHSIFLLFARSYWLNELVSLKLTDNARQNLKIYKLLFHNFLTTSYRSPPKWMPAFNSIRTFLLLLSVCLLYELSEWNVWRKDLDRNKIVIHSFVDSF